MLSIVSGIITAIVFATGTLLSARLSRSMGAFPVVAWASMIGLVMTLPFAVAKGFPDGVSIGVWSGLVLAGLGNIAGFACVFTALRYGKVGLVAPVVATEGAVAAILAAITGRSIAPVVALLLTAIMVGIVIAARSPDPVPMPHERNGRAVLLATGGSIGFGVSLFTVGVLSGTLPMEWVLIPGRIVGTVAVALPLLALRRLTLPWRSMPLLAVLAATDIVGLVVYSIGAQRSLPITAVMASQMAPIAAILAFFFFKERLSRGQIIGMIVIVLGISALSLVQ